LFLHALLELGGVEVAAGPAGATGSAITNVSGRSARPAVATEITGAARAPITGGRAAGAATVVILSLQISAAQTQGGNQS
jgi:hypothetical protein